MFEAKLKAAIDNRKSKSVPISNAVFDPLTLCFTASEVLNIF